MPVSRKRKKQVNKKKNKKKDSVSYIYNYYSRAFRYFHTLIASYLKPSNKCRKIFWNNIPNGKYNLDKAEIYLKDYKAFIEFKLEEIIHKYSIVYWLHVSRRIAPNTMGEDNQPETIRICRNIITAAIQKYGQLKQCGNIKHSSEVQISEIFNGLFLKPEFAYDFKYFKEAPAQLVLINFNENNIFEYYELERLAYELWLIGSKSRIIAKGANLIVNNQNDYILLDDRTPELKFLIDNYDNRISKMNASATGTVFNLPDASDKGNILITQIFIPDSDEIFNNQISKYLDIKFPKGNFPNFEFCVFDIKTYLQVHMSFADDFSRIHGVKLEYVISIITDIALGIAHSIFNEKDIAIAGNLFFRSYKIFNLLEFKEYIQKNWATTTNYLDINIPFDKTEVDKAFDFMSLTKKNKEQIFVDSFGPLKLFTPSAIDTEIIIDYSIVGDFLYNLFAGIPLKDRSFKGEFLEIAIRKNKSFLPTKESKAIDRTSKQVDYSIAKGNILILAECKAVARSFGIFSGQAKALDHRFRNVIQKGLDDVDKKIIWFLEHKKGANYDISNFKFIIGVVVSPFTEFIPSHNDKYWLNDNLPRVLTIEEFEKLIDSDLGKTITKNLIKIE